MSLVNDTDQPWGGPVAFSLQTLDGEVRSHHDEHIEVPARGVLTLPVRPELSTPQDPSTEALIVSMGPGLVVHTFVEDVDLRLNPAPLEASANALAGGYEITVKAHSLARDITLHVDRLDPAASVDHALVTLPAGAEWSFKVSSDVEGLDPAQFLSSAVLRTANDLRAVPTQALDSTAATTA